MTGPTAPQDSNHQASAMDRVLNTHELLDIILLQVSPDSKANLARVSPVWNDLLSKHRHIDPYSNSLGLDYRDQCAGLPHYTSDITFRINPAVEQDYEPMSSTTAQNSTRPSTTSTASRCNSALNLSRTRWLPARMSSLQIHRSRSLV